MERDPSLREDLVFEDVVIGEVWRTLSHRVTDKDISDFAAVTHDHHPLHPAPLLAFGSAYAACDEDLGAEIERPQGKT